MGKYLEKPGFVFNRVPEIEDICIEFGVDMSNAELVTCMYELYCRVSGIDPFCNQEDMSYKEGYRDGYNSAIEEVENMVDSVSWEIGRLKKQ